MRVTGNLGGRRRWRSNLVRRLSKASRRLRITDSGSPPSPAFATARASKVSRRFPSSLEAVQREVYGRLRVRGLNSRVRRAARWHRRHSLPRRKWCEWLVVRDDPAKFAHPQDGGRLGSEVVDFTGVSGTGVGARQPVAGCNDRRYKRGFLKQKRASILPALARKLARGRGLKLLVDKQFG